MQLTLNDVETSTLNTALHSRILECGNQARWSTVPDYWKDEQTRAQAVLDKVYEQVRAERVEKGLDHDV